MDKIRVHPKFTSEHNSDFTDLYAVRREDAFTFRPRDSGGGGPLELAKRANRGGGGAGVGASLPVQKDDSAKVSCL